MKCKQFEHLNFFKSKTTSLREHHYYSHHYHCQQNIYPNHYVDINSENNQKRYRHIHFLNKRKKISLIKNYCKSITNDNYTSSSSNTFNTKQDSDIDIDIDITEYKPKLQIKEIFGEDDGESMIGREIEVSGWVKTFRNQKTFAFIELSDGSMMKNLQIIIGEEMVEGYHQMIKDNQIHTGTAITVKGMIVKSPGGKQKIELKGKYIKIIGTCDPVSYPLQKKRHSLEFLRSIAHLRARTNTASAIARIRSALVKATVEFFDKHGFIQIHTPILTASDCEGAGEMFQVTTLFNDNEIEMDASSSSSKEIDYSKDFFGKQTYLSVSGQLNAEMYACALGRVYTFNPAFRAENSNTSRHLAEFWMIEPEMAFCELDENISCATSYLKHCINYLFEHCSDDLSFFEKFYDKQLYQKLKVISDGKFKRITYTEAIEILEKSGEKFEFEVKWGLDLQSEHERYLTEKVYEGIPVVITDYPKDIKAFYMKLNNDNKTVAAMDILVPKIGELIGGSQREDNYEKLKERIEASGLNSDDYWWYLDLRKYGSVPHSGFGLGFERLVQFVTGIDNIRDVIAFPRYPDHCQF